MAELIIRDLENFRVVEHNGERWQGTPERINPSKLVNFGTARCRVAKDNPLNSFYQKAVEIGNRYHADYVLVSENPLQEQHQPRCVPNIDEPITLYLKKKGLAERLCEYLFERKH